MTMCKYLTTDLLIELKYEAQKLLQMINLNFMKLN